MSTIDRTNTTRVLVRHTPDGEIYIVEYASVWDGDEVLDVTQIIAGAGPIDSADLPAELTPSVALYNAIDTWNNLTDEDADWLQAEDTAGRLDYFVGAR